MAAARIPEDTHPDVVREPAWLAWIAGGVALVLAAAFLQVGEARAEVLVAGGKAMPAAKATRGAERLRAAYFPESAAARYTLPAAPPASAFAPQGDEKRTRIGIARDFANEAPRHEGPAAPAWIDQPDGARVARLAVTSIAAGAVRVGLAVRGLPPAAELRFHGAAEPQRVLGPVSGVEVAAQALSQGRYWTPLTAGDTQVVEVWVPAGAPLPVVQARAVSHLALAPADFLKSTGVGASQACEQDVACAARGDAALEQASRSVAKLLYTENGASYLCTATLVNDGNADTHVPYLYTAAHCIDTQAAAATVNSFWFFEASSCGSKSATDYTQLARGATLLYADAASDAALLRLTEPPPAGAWFAGWDATPLAGGAAVVALHHPAGDLKKVSLGLSMGATESTGASYFTAAWVSGSTEGGSSGSGLFTLAGGQYLLRGALRGGSASCTTSGNVADPSNRDYYSRLDQVAPKLKAWFNAAPAPLADYTGMWYVPSEPGWGLSIVQGLDNRVFVTWYRYDAAGKPTWSVAPEVTWTAADALTATLYDTAGPPAGGVYDAAKFALWNCGSLKLTFAADGSALLEATLGGMGVRKTLTRLAI